MFPQAWCSEYLFNVILWSADGDGFGNANLMTRFASHVNRHHAVL
jgi:hypothetical protein